MKKKGTWDEGIAYETLKKRLQNKIRYILEKHRGESEYPTKLAYLTTYAIQLRNGLRISEAHEAFMKFYVLREYQEITKRKLVTTVMVRKKRDKLVTREAIYPEFVPISILNKTIKNAEKVTTGSLISNARYYIDVNTHSIRYAFITHVAKKGIHPLIITKITMQSDPKVVLRYIQQIEAQEILLDENLY